MQSLDLNSQLTAALKEWAVAVDALATGKTILLLRKGGIRERGAFHVTQSQVWLYPTYEHQKAHLLKPEYAAQVTPVEPGWHPEQIAIQAWGTITHVFSIQEAGALAALLPFHIWNAQFAVERFHWKPNSPLCGLLLRVYQLPTSHAIPYCATYGGCQSWIQLQATLPDPTAASPVLTDTDYQNQVETILNLSTSAS